MSDQEDNKGFTVKDKRRFDSEGNPKEEVDSTKESASEGATKSSTKQEQTGGSVAEDAAVSAETGAGPVGEVDFSSFVVSLATQALIQLGEMEAPEGMPVEVNREGAKNAIDILGILRQKTTGNLDENEAKLMEEVLHSLHIAFVRSGQKD